MTESLQQTTADTHRDLRDKMGAVTAAVQDHADRPEIVRTADAAIIALCQHQAAVCDVLLPLTGQRARTKGSRSEAYVRQARQVEHIASLARGRLYGAVQASRTPWSQIWARLGAEVDVLLDIETHLVRDLMDQLDIAAQEQAAARMDLLSPSEPTRPHPHSPHSGRFSHLSRAWWTRADRIWDVTQGRGASRRAS